ncbi:hypothetical protein ABZP36_017536 [Zizania latifolia]
MEVRASDARDAVATVNEEGDAAPVDVGAMGLVLAPRGEDVAAVLQAMVDPPTDESIATEATTGAVIEGGVVERFVFRPI